MPSLSYGVGAYDRDTGSLPELRLVNMFAEKALTSEGSVCIQSRAGLSTSHSAGSGPIRSLFAAPDIFSGAIFAVSGASVSPTLYRGTTSLGTLTNMAGTVNRVISLAGRAGEVLVAGGGTLYSYNGTNLTAPFTVGGASNDVLAVTFIGSLFCAIENNTGRVYWSSPLDGRTWDALDFFTAEREADRLRDIAALNDKLILYGASSIEVWAHTGDSDLPFTRIEGIGSQFFGIFDTGSWCRADNTVFHVGSDSVVYRFGESFERVSDHWLEEKISTSAVARLFSCKYQGHEFVVLRLQSQTFAYDCATQEWCEFQTSGSNWIAQCAAMKEAVAYFGNSSDGKVMIWSTGWQDISASMMRLFTAATQLDEPTSIDNVRVWANVGNASSGSPTVTLDYSRDAGQTYASAGSVSLGTSGQYGTRVQWRRLGMFAEPGAMFQIYTSDNCPFRVSAVKYNENLGGRSR